jgi:predicted oxidoreductase
MAITAMGTLWEPLWARSSSHRQILPKPLSMESQAAGNKSWEHPVMAMASFLKPMKHHETLWVNYDIFLRKVRS